MYNIVSNIIYSITQFFLNAIALIMKWIFQLVNCVGLSNSSFFGAMDKDFVTQIFPKLNNFSADFISIGYFIAFVLFIFALLMLLFPYSDFEPPADNAFQLVFRFGVALLMVFGFEGFFLNVLYDKLIVPMFNYFNGAVGITESAWEGTHWFLDTLAGRLDAGHTSAIGQIINLILTIIFGLMFIVQAFKFTIYHYEKLFFTRLLIYCIPIASGTLATKKSSAIFKNYFNMLLVNCISLIVNVFICGLIMSGLLNVNAAATRAAANLETQLNGGFFLTCTKTFIAGLMLLTAALKVGKKMSVYISQLFNMNGMSDAVRDGLGMFSVAVGYAGHMISQNGMKKAMRNAEKNENAGDEKRARETQASLNNINSTLSDLKDDLSGQAYANGYNEAKMNQDVDDAMKKSGLDKINSVDLDEEVRTESDGIDTDKTKPSSPENYNNPLDKNDDMKATDTSENQKSPDTNNDNQANEKNSHAVQTDQNNMGVNDQNNQNAEKDSKTNPVQTETSQNNADKSESNNSQKINGISTQSPNAKPDKDSNNDSSVKNENSEKAAQTDNSQIQNNQKDEQATDTDKANVQDNSKLDEHQNNQLQKGADTENINSSVPNQNHSEGKNIENSQNTVNQNTANGGKSVEGNDHNSSVNVKKDSSTSEKGGSSQAGANITSNERTSHHSSAQNSSAEQKNISTQNNRSSNTHTSRSDTGVSRETVKSSHNVSNGSANTSNSRNVGGSDSANKVHTSNTGGTNRTNNVNMNSSNTTHTQSTNNSDRSKRPSHKSPKTQNTGNKTEL